MLSAVLEPGVVRAGEEIAALEPPLAADRQLLRRRLEKPPRLTWV
jgi:hypothetical protein